jgi:hypothetical protein
MERKRLSLREGGRYEEEAIMEALSKLILAAGISFQYDHSYVAR